MSDFFKEKKFLNKHFGTDKLLCNNVKDTKYRRLKVENALKKNFIQYNSNLITMISIDVDNCDIYAIANRLEKLPKHLQKPTLLVQTTNGWHIHYALKKSLAYNTQNRDLVERIRRGIGKIVDGDKNARGVRRIFRNPLTHSVASNDIAFKITDFKEVTEAPVKLRKIKGKRNRNQNKKIYEELLKTDFTQVYQGSRNVTMFDYLRVSAYRWGLQKDLREVLTDLANNANNQMVEPLSITELEGIINSIMRFMETKYNGKGYQVEFNRKLAKKKHEDTIKKIIKALKDNTIESIDNLSNREVALVAKVSPTTVGKHRKEIIEILAEEMLSEVYGRTIEQVTDDMTIEYIEKELVPDMWLKEFNNVLADSELALCGEEDHTDEEVRMSEIRLRKAGVLKPRY